MDLTPFFSFPIAFLSFSLLLFLAYLSALQAAKHGVMLSTDVPLEPLPEPQNSPTSPVPPQAVPIPAPESEALDWSTQKGAFHLTRVMCDDMGVPLAKTHVVEGTAYSLKDIICACLYQESRFRNYKPDGTPMLHRNVDPVTGVVWSTDWGIAQINDHPGWHIGPGCYFSSIEDVLDHTDKAVGYMIKMAQAGKLSLWSSYKGMGFAQWLVPSSPMWALRS